ncbi:MAG TPA: GH1 family beta-glucosidase [Gaiellaceae bacterium]|nr:GH1 family beta-glucosidase [Gaiellaceae bacterium]
MSFPSDFVWGTATAAYQIEGAATADGRGESIWDRFCATPGKVRNGESGAVACDFHGRYRDDVELMRELGIDAFRFSIAWPRILPGGRGRVNEAGLDFYDRLVDALLEAGLQPFPTLYHWDLPQALEDAGGWPVRETAEAFVEYVEAVVRRLGDRVATWTTHNEPFCASWVGYAYGHHAPGRKSEADALAAAHHLLLSHGWAVEVLRRESRAPVGIVLDLSPVHPLGPGDEEAADQLDGARNRFFLDAVLRGSYPEDVLARLAPHLPPVADGDLRAIAAPLDFVGVNTYSRQLVRAAPGGGEPVVVRAPRGPLTDMGWEIYPDALYEILKRVDDDYAPPALYVTENGAAFADVRTHDGRIHDLERIEYLAAHVASVERAVAAGVPVRGYFVWSLLDNFEWAHGYSRRFGLVFVDYPTLERVPKQSFYWYRDLIASRRAQAAAA